MAIVDIFNLQQNVISKDLKGKFVCLYGGEKIGKSTFGSKLPRGLFCNFEMGTNFLNVKAQPIEKWTDFKQVVKQLEKPEAKELYDTVIIDTIGRAYTLCENYICQREGVQKLGQIPYGAGCCA